MRASLFFAVAVATLGATACEPAPPPNNTGSQSYGAGADQKIRVVQAGSAGKPVAVSVMGGGYHGLHDGVTPALAAKLPGWRVLQISYTPGTVNSVEAQVETAFAWIANNPGWVGTAPGNIRIMGESAGGQVALRAGLKNKVFANNKMYSLAGTSEIDRWHYRWDGHQVGEVIQQVTGCQTVTWNACATVRDASPSSHARPGPQLFFIHGKADGMVPYEVSSLAATRYGAGSSYWQSSGNHLDTNFVNDAAAVILAVG